MMYSYYRISDGAVANQRYTGAEPELNGPPGHAPIAGKLDPRREYVALVTDDFGDQKPIVKPQMPPCPADTPNITWSWDAVAGDWTSRPTLLGLQRQASEPILRELTALDAPLTRPLTDLLLALLGGAEAPEAALAKVTAVEAQKTGLRSRLAQIEAATSPEALATLVASWSA